MTNDPAVLTLGAAQVKVGRWARAMFGSAVHEDRRERARRIFEEAAELAQAEGVAGCECAVIVDYVYRKPKGNPELEAGQLGQTLLAWADSARVSLWTLIDSEMKRVSKFPKEHWQSRQRAKADIGTARAPE